MKTSRLKNILLFICLLQFQLLLSASPETDLIKWELKGRVKELTETKFCLGNVMLKTRSIVRFNKQGNIREELECDSKGKYTGKTTYKYNSKRHLIEQNVFFSDGSLAGSKTFQYNTDNKIISENEFAKDENPKEKRNRKINYQYAVSDSGMITNRFDAFDRLVSKSLTTNTLLSKITEYKYNTDDSLFVKYTFCYDDKENLIESCYYSADGNLYMKDTCIYNEKQQLKEKIGYLSQKTILNPPVRQAFTYNEHNDIEKVLEYYANGTLTTITLCEYVYDKVGNWTEKRINRNNRKELISKRKITYY
jgi:hypothetical protein